MARPRTTTESLAGRWAPLNLLSVTPLLRHSLSLTEFLVNSKDQVRFYGGGGHHLLYVHVHGVIFCDLQVLFVHNYHGAQYTWQ